MTDEAATGGRPRRLRRRHILLLAALGFVLVLWVLWQRCGVSGCPNVERLSAYQPGGAPVLLDAAGEQFADLSPIEHEVVSLDSLPPHVPGAFVAVEDRRFYTHRGVDYRRVVGALLADIRARGFVQGFSTITMQLARNVWPERLPGQQRTLTRKILEVRVAREIEREFEKDEILELYLNHIYFGDGAYGIAAAAQNYFRKPAQELTVAEAALLAAMPKSPTYYNPRRFRERAQQRRDLVLTLMEREQVIEPEQAEAAREQRVRVRRDPPAPRTDSIIAPYFVDAVRHVLESRFGEDLYTAPLRIHTTLDRRVQRIAEEQLERQLRNIERGTYGRFSGERYVAGADVGEETEYLQGAVVVLSADSGSVRALVGGRDYAQSRFNRATRARRQPGSAFKPFVYAAALADGFPPSQLISDSTLRLDLPGGEVWEPRNMGGEYERFVSLRDALVRSKNIPTIRLAREVGIDDVRRTAERAGITTEIPELPSIAIGSATVSPLELTAAYTAFANLGEAAPPRFVVRVEGPDGGRIWRPRVRRRDVLEPEAAYVLNDILTEAVTRGTGNAVRRSGYQGVAAGKTGTTNDAADVWFVGYTPEHVASVWIGFDRPQAISANASGGRLAAPVWGRLMRRVYAEDQPSAWERPEHVLARPVDPSTGYVLIEGCRPERGEAREELFVEDTEPPASCPRGKPAPGVATVFDRFGDWLARRWHAAMAWLARHVGTEDPQRPRTDERNLGVPRLPRAIETPDIQIDVLVPPMDSVLTELPPLPDSIQPGLAVDTLLLDTLPLDTLLPDTLPLDTIPRARAEPDTLPAR